MFFKEYDLLSKSGLFDAAFYLASYPDVAVLNIDPLLHYLEQGAGEGRNPRADFDSAYYLEQCRHLREVPGNPLLHFITVGARLGLKPSPAAGPGHPLLTLSQSPEGPSDVLLSIDRFAFSRSERGSLRLVVEGWALAQAPITEISLLSGGVPIGQATHGLARPDVASSHPAYDGADHAGFSIVVDPVPQSPKGTIELTLSAKVSGGGLSQRSFTVPIPDPGDQSSLREEIQETPNAPDQSALPPLRLEVDRIELGPDRILTVSGWVVCFVDIAAVRIYVDGTLVGSAETGRRRDDIALACSEYPHARDSGFAFAGIIGDDEPGRKIVKVEATTSSGVTRERLLPVTLAETTAAGPAVAAGFHYHCDELQLSVDGWLKVQGWVVAETPSDAIVLGLDGVDVGRAQPGVERPDVGNLFPSVPHARYAGFRFHQNLGRAIPAAEHVVRLKVRGAGGEENEVPLPVLAIDRPIPPEVSTPAPFSAVSDADRVIYVDAPTIVDGAADTSVTGNLSISGWALARAGVQAIKIAVDGIDLVAAHYGVRREDVAEAFPDRNEALMSGFAALIPNWQLPKGQHTMSIAMLDRAGKTAVATFRIQVEEAPEGDGPWRLRRKISRAEIDLQTRILADLNFHPSFRIVLPIESNPGSIEQARSSLASLRDQAYPNWRVLMVAADSKSDLPVLRKALLSGFDDITERVSVESRKSAVALLKSVGRERREPTYLAPLAAGDELSCDALLELAIAAGIDHGADLLYSDERRVSPVTQRQDAYFKPGWSPDLLLSTNYIGRLWCARADVWTKAAIKVDDWLDHGTYDLVLRATEQAQTIRHVPIVLCQRGSSEAESPRLEQEALTRALARRRIKAVVRDGCKEGIYRVKRKRATQGRVSIIIPTCGARGLIRTCLDTLRSKTAYKNFEVICIENIPVQDRKTKRWLAKNADKVLEAKEPFNWSRFNNRCVAEASGKFLLFLNDDVEIIEADWLDVLLEHAERPEVGVVGPRLLYGDGSVQHAGLALTTAGKARHLFRHAQPSDPGYFGLARTERNVIGVTGACLMTRRDVFESVGGFDEAHAIVNNDLDYCLKTWAKGYLNVYTPHAELIHHELASRGEMGDVYDEGTFLEQWREIFLKGDPYFNSNLSRNFDDLTVEREPLRIVCAGHPLLARESVSRILVQKLDHIGDCITALPALRRLKQYFPKAHVSVLAHRATRTLWESEPAVDEVLEFEFFHARSGLGRTELTEDVLTELRRQLETKRFDLAVDLRKSPDTRDILRCSGARFLAGFDYRGGYPWLDIALEWEGDTQYQLKRQHVADDLLNLVHAIAAMSEPDRQVLTPAKGRLTLPAKEIDRIFSKRVVCIHPASGNEMRQWPPQYFGELIDLLVANHEVHAVLIGGPEELPIAQTVLAHVEHKEAVFSLVGRLKLAELSGLIARCALFVGNNSGPQHLSAALGVPTIGVHSGVVDPREWGPLGPYAVAVRRDMSCSPCYLEKRENCPKELACLRGLNPAAVYRMAERMLAIRIASPQIEAPKAKPVRTSKLRR